jgi:hypothetical protein
MTLLTVSPVAAELIYGLADPATLILFDSQAPGAILRSAVITGLQAGEVLHDIDVRPATRQLYGFGVTALTSGRLYRIDPLTAVATQIGPTITLPQSLGVPANAALYSTDFNPTVDRLRVISALGDNFRVHPDTGQIVGVDAKLSADSLVGAAYDRNRVGLGLTTLFAYNFNPDEVARIGGVDGSPSPNLGVVTNIGASGFTAIAEAVGFDISPRGTAFVALVPVVAEPSRLFTANLQNGQLTDRGAIGNLYVRALAVSPLQNVLVTGAGAGGGPHVRVFDETGAPRLELFPFPLSFAGGVSVALCDVTGDGVLDVVAGAGPGGGPHVRIFDGGTGLQVPGLIGSFFAFPASFSGGVRVSCTDLNQDGFGDVVVGAGPGGGPHVQVFDGKTGQPVLAHPLASFFPYAVTFTGGVFVGGGE